MNNGGDVPRASGGVNLTVHVHGVDTGNVNAIAHAVESVVTKRMRRDGLVGH